MTRNTSDTAKLLVRRFGWMRAYQVARNAAKSRNSQNRRDPMGISARWIHARAIHNVIWMQLD